MPCLCGLKVALDLESKTKCHRIVRLGAEDAFIVLARERAGLTRISIYKTNRGPARPNRTWWSCRSFRARRSLSGSPDWLKFKNPAAPAVRREAEEDSAVIRWLTTGNGEDLEGPDVERDDRKNLDWIKLFAG